MRTIEIGGTRYPILFNVTVFANVQDRYKSIDVLPEKLHSIKETLWMLTQIINEADRYQKVNGGGGTLQEPMTEEKLGMLMTFDDLTNKNLAMEILCAFNEGLDGRKNRQAGQGKKKSRSGKRMKKTSSTLPGSNSLQ